MFIGTIRDSHDEILKYRLLDTDTKKITDIPLEKLLDAAAKGIVENLESIGDKTGVAVKNGDIHNFPIIYSSMNKVKNNIPVVIALDNGVITVANYEGKLVTLPEGTLLSKINKFANAKIENGRIALFIRDSKPIDLYSLVMQSNAVPSIDINGFDGMRFADKLGVSKDIYSLPSDVFIQRENKLPLEIECDNNAYGFEIENVGNNVELRKYIEKREYRGKVVIPAGVTHICKGAFKQCKAMELDMPDTVVYLGDSSFSHSKLIKINLSKNVKAIPLECFYSSYIEEIDLTHITSIDNLAFSNSNIKEVVLRAPIVQIGYEAFKGCSNLKKFEHAGTLKKIRHHAFDGCKNLLDFDLSSVETIEKMAFHDTGLVKVVINGNVRYLQTGTFTGAVEEVVLLDGMYKIAGDAASNIYNRPITWNIPKSVTNIDKSAIKSIDTVICYRNSIAASSAMLAEANIAYLDDLDASLIPKMIKKANLLNSDVSAILSESIKKIFSTDDEQGFEFEVDESKLMRLDLPENIIDWFIGTDIMSKAYATDDDIANERCKFKCILYHLSRVAKIDTFPFSDIMCRLKSTFQVVADNSSILYQDGVSTVVRVSYVDNKYTSINSSFIIAKTKDTIRYVCMDNKYTDFVCESADTKDLKPLLRALAPGDTIGLNSVISGVRYPEIVYKSNKKIEVSRSGSKIHIDLKMNIYQALRYGGVTFRLDNNIIAIMLPGNKTILKCASSGKSVWLNEREETYKSLQCVIESIEDIYDSKVFDYDATYNSLNYGVLFKRISGLSANDVDKYIDTYSHIFPAKVSRYRQCAEYAYQKGINSISDIDNKFISLLVSTLLFEERPVSWLASAKGKTIVPDRKHLFKLSDGLVLKQYRAVKKTALRNKLMSGGDKKIYIFEILNKSGITLGVYLSIYDISTLVEMCLSMVYDKNSPNLQSKVIYKDKSKFDVVDYSDIIEIAELCKGAEFYAGYFEFKFILASYKYNGLYYICLKIKRGNTYVAMPIIQIGELQVALGLIEESNKSATSSKAMQFLIKASTCILVDYTQNNLGRQSNLYIRSQSRTAYEQLSSARRLCIDGVTDIESYNQTGVNEIIKRCFGVSQS